MRCAIKATDSLGLVRSHTVEFESEILARAGALNFAATLLGQGEDKGNGRRLRLEVATDDGRPLWIIDIAFLKGGDDGHPHDAESEAHPS